MDREAAAGGSLKLPLQTSTRNGQLRELPTANYKFQSPSQSAARSIAVSSSCEWVPVFLNIAFRWFRAVSGLTMELFGDRTRPVTLPEQVEHLPFPR